MASNHSLDTILTGTMPPRDNFMSLTMSRLVHDAIIARFHIQPVPRSLSQTIAIYTYFTNLTSQANLIQYRHARDAASGQRLNHFHLLISDPLPPIDPKTESFIVGGDNAAAAQEEASQTMGNVSFDNSLLGDLINSTSTKSEKNDSEAVDYTNSDHAERIAVWRKHRLSAKQATFPSRLDALASKLRSLTQNGKRLGSDITSNEFKSLWDETTAYIPLSATEMAERQKDSKQTQDGPTTGGDRPRAFGPIVHLTSQADKTLLLSPVEHGLVNTSQIVLDNLTNTVVPLEQVLYDRFTADNGRLVQDYNAENNHDLFYDSQRYTHFGLSLTLMTREPRAVTYSSTMSLANKAGKKGSKHKSKNYNTTNAMVDLRQDALEGFTGSIGFEI